MKEITNKEEMVKWAELVNHCTTLKEQVDLQDVWGRSNYETLKKVYTGELGNDRYLITFSLFKAMGENTTFDLLKIYCRKLAMNMMEEYIKDTDESINARWAQLNRGRKL